MSNPRYTLSINAPPSLVDNLILENGETKTPLSH
jgi:hypothetical protein